MSGTRPVLAERLRESRLLIAAGVFDALSAVLAERAGFEAVFVSGSALAATRLARPDVGLLTATELADAVGRVCERIGIPVLVDADYGFGGVMNVYRTVKLLEAAGASGIQLEDRREAVPPAEVGKRPLVEAGVMADKIRAAVDARRAATTVISARTDALFSTSMDESLRRAEIYLEAGADVIFVEGCRTAAARREVAARLSGRVPLLFNTGILDRQAFPEREEFEQLGYSIVLFPGELVGAASEAMQRALAGIRAWAGEPSAPPADLPTAIEADAFLGTFC